MRDTPSVLGVADDPPPASKADLRRWAHARRKVITHQAMVRVSQAVCRRLAGLLADDLPEDAHGSVVVGLYAAMATEIHLDPLAASLSDGGVTVAFPRVGQHGLLSFHEVTHIDRLVLRQPAHRLPPIREPADEAPTVVPDVVVAPGLSFDADGGRLGYGGGYYDRYLAGHDIRRVIGVCASALIVPHVPRESHDRVVDAVVTEHDVYRC